MWAERRAGAWRRDEEDHALAGCMEPEQSKEACAAGGGGSGSPGRFEASYVDDLSWTTFEDSAEPADSGGAPAKLY